MSKRYFSEAVKFNAVKLNLEKNHGEIRCEICRKQIFSIQECHFDHIISYAKGGKSTLDNCQILCVACNLNKYNKEQEEILMDKKARRFLSGEPMDGDISQSAIILEKNNGDKMTKEKFDSIVGEYITENGDIRQIDFSRAKNHLPGISYMIKYYGTLNELKKAHSDIQNARLFSPESLHSSSNNYIITKLFPKIKILLILGNVF